MACPLSFAQNPRGFDLIDSRPVLVSQDAVEAAPTHPPELVVVSVKVAVPEHCVGRVIGRAGETVQRIRASTGAEIVVPSRAAHPALYVERPVAISGLLSAVQAALVLLLDAMYEGLSTVVYTHATVSYKSSPASGRSSVVSSSGEVRTPPGSPGQHSGSGHRKTRSGGLSLPVSARNSPVPDSEVCSSITTSSTNASPAVRRTRTPSQTSSASAEATDGSVGCVAAPVRHRASAANPLAFNTATPQLPPPLGYVGYSPTPPSPYVPGYAYPPPMPSPPVGWMLVHPWYQPVAYPVMAPLQPPPPPPPVYIPPTPVAPPQCVLCPGACACTRESISIPRGVVGVVLGKEGNTLRWIQAQTRTRIVLSSRHEGGSEDRCGVARAWSGVVISIV